MNIKSKLNIIAVLSIGAVLVLYGYLWISTIQINSQLNEIGRIDRFTQAASELNILTEQYLAYREERYLASWDSLYARLVKLEKDIEGFSYRNVIDNALPSIKSAFSLIRQTVDNPVEFNDPEARDRLLDRASARIRSDSQILLSLSHRLAEQKRESVRNLQVNRSMLLLFILIPVVFLIGYFIYQLRTRILDSLNILLAGTARIAEGDLDARIEVRGADEHARLASSFNTMTTRLQTHIEKEKEARREAEEKQRRWEKLVEQDPSLILIQVDGEIVFINTSGASILGTDSPEEVVGTSVYDYIDKEKITEARERVRRVEMDNRPVSPTIYKVSTLDGRERYLQVESKPIRYSGQNATQTVGLDISRYIKYENELRKSVEEKTTLLQEVHHRVKNNLAVVSGLLFMQRFSTDNPEVTELLGESERRIKSMALIHEMLYQSSSLSSIPIDEYIEKLIEYVRESFDPERTVDIRIAAESFKLNVNQAVPCALIINELVSNALKHAFTEQNKGIIRVRIEKNERQVGITVADNGKGLPEELDIEHTDSLGFTIVHTLIGQLDGELELDGEEGTRISFSFELTKAAGSSSILPDRIG